MQFGEKDKNFCFSRLIKKLGKINIFQISETAQGSNTLTLSPQNYNVLFSVEDAHRA